MKLMHNHVCKKKAINKEPINQKKIGGVNKNNQPASLSGIVRTLLRVPPPDEYDEHMMKGDRG
jgi:hypothetical protein